jgi:ubiquinone/menaquinone biosynthesis C-methylase UbiE
MFASCSVGFAWPIVVAMEPQTGTGAIDEMACAGRENLDPQHVARYDAKEDAGAATEMVMLALLGIGAGATVVDLGAGTGQFTLEAAAVAKRVIAVDVSPVMLARLRGKLDRSGVENVETVEAGFLTYEHAGEPADLVYSRLALHHLPDFW